MPISSQPTKGLVSIPVSIGELADKITILEIKAENITEPEKLAHVRCELALLRDVWTLVDAHGFDLAAIVAQLKETNSVLWTVEDEIRSCEARRDFGPRFVELAREVYRVNDRRYEFKRRINELTHSSIVEEKSYNRY